MWTGQIPECLSSNAPGSVGPTMAPLTSPECRLSAVDHGPVTVISGFCQFLRNPDWRVVGANICELGLSLMGF